jgi:hypothetical protein
MNTRLLLLVPLLVLLSACATPVAQASFNDGLNTSVLPEQYMEVLAENLILKDQVEDLTVRVEALEKEMKNTPSYEHLQYPIKYNDIQLRADVWVLVNGYIRLIVLDDTGQDLLFDQEMTKGPHINWYLVTPEDGKISGSWKGIVWVLEVEPADTLEFLLTDFDGIEDLAVRRIPAFEIGADHRKAPESVRLVNDR